MSPAALKARALAAARREVGDRRRHLATLISEVNAAAAEAKAGRINYTDVRDLGGAVTRAIFDLASAVDRVNGIVSGRIHEGPW